MNNWQKCYLWAEKMDLEDGKWYILEIKGTKRPFLGRWDEKNDRFIGSGLVGKELDEAIPLKSGKIEWILECPRKEITDKKDKRPSKVTIYVSEDDIWHGLDNQTGDWEEK